MYEGTGPRITEDTPNGFRAGRDTLDWNDIKWLRDRWPGKLLIKGVMHPEDAQAAASLGADALILKLLCDDVDHDLTMLGCASVDELTAELLYVCGPPAIDAKARATH